MKVWIVVYLEGGWDNISGVFDSEQKAKDLLKAFGYDEEDIDRNNVNEYYIHEKEVH